MAKADFVLTTDFADGTDGQGADVRDQRSEVRGRKAWRKRNNDERPDAKPDNWLEKLTAKYPKYAKGNSFCPRFAALKRQSDETIMIYNPKIPLADPFPLESGN
jgi:hypothetical protein